MSDRYRKKPVEVSAMLMSYDEDDHQSCVKELDEFCGRNWSRADAVDHAWEGNADDPFQVVVWNTKEKQWLQVPDGHWVIRGIDGELYPCDPGVFERTYEEVTTP